jgi:photosystem II stability/assembly factor-like uncharacterized protein
MKKLNQLLLTVIFTIYFPTIISAQDFWQVTNFSINTNVYSIVVNSKGQIFAGTKNGVYKSTDNGNNWTFNNLSDVVNSIVINAQDQLFAATNNSGICRSEDDGDNWFTVFPDTTSALYLNIPANGDIYYCNSIGELYNSTDNGDNWQQILHMTKNTAMWAFTKDLNNYLYLGTYNYGAFRVNFEGTNLVSNYLYNTGLTDSTIWTFTLNNAGQIFAGTNNSGIYRSLNNGDTWIQINNGLTNFKVWTLACNSTGDLFAGTDGSGVFRSRDNGETWEQINTGLTNNQVLYLYVDKSGYLWACTIGGGIFRSKISTILPATINVNTNLSFSDVSKQTSYQMFGLPGNFDLPLSQVLTGSADKDWTAYWDNGAEEGTSYLQKYDGTSTFNFKPGRAFWILSKNSIAINRNVNSVTLTNNYYSIPLHTGWNLISNPFNKNVNWNDIEQLNGGILQPIHNYNNGTYSQPAVFEPYEGYYFLNDLNLQTLKIPYIIGLTSPNENTLFLNKLPSDNVLKLVLESEEGQNEYVNIMIDEKSIDGSDNKDIYAPPNNFSDKSISIYNEKLSASYKYLMVDSRKEIGDGQQYELKIKNHGNGIVFLKVEGIEYFKNFEIYLLDNNLKRFYNIKQLNRIDLPKIHNELNFTLLIGSENYVNKFKNELMPDRFELYQNYPNPFNPLTTLKYGIPEESNVRLLLYNSLGELVKIFTEKKQAAGYYEINFDGSRLSSGVYYYSFASTSLKNGQTFRCTKKMVLLK